MFKYTATWKERMQRKGQGMPLNVIVIAVIVLIVLVVIFVIFGQRSKTFVKDLEGEDTNRETLENEIKDIFSEKASSKCPSGSVSRLVCSKVALCTFREKTCSSKDTDKGLPCAPKDDGDRGTCSK